VNTLASSTTKLTKRQTMERLIYKTFDALDKSGTNSTHYKSIFEPMSDSEFNTFFEKFFENPNEYLILYVEEFKFVTRLEDAGDAAKVLGIPLMEYVYMPHITMDKTNIMKTKQKCLVGYINLKRPQQMVSKKTGVSTNASIRKTSTGQLMSKDKNGRNADTETMILLTQGANAILKELHGPRSDDMSMKEQMNEQIATDGYVELAKMDSSPENKQSLNLVDAYFIGMQLKTDLVTNGDYTIKTVQDISKY
jgi:hypothetical protein